MCSCHEVGTNEVTSPHSELIGSCDCQNEVDDAGGDVTAVDLLRVKVNPREHKVTSSYKACLVCAISLDGEDPFHWYKVLSVIDGHDDSRMAQGH